jgi:Flp pilus assembly protein TadG
MTRRPAALIRDDRGAAIIEMALVVPFLAALLIGMTDISRAYSMKVQMTQAAQRAIEKAMQGKKDTSVYNTLQAEAATAAGVDPSAVVATFWLECGNNPPVSQMQSRATMAADYDRVCSPGVPFARYVSVDVTKTYSPIFSTRFAGANADGSYTIHGRALIRVQ